MNENQLIKIAINLIIIYIILYCFICISVTFFMKSNNSKLKVINIFVTLMGIALGRLLFLIILVAAFASVCQMLLI